MDKGIFVDLLRSNALPTENVYEDISEIGYLLWNNSRSSLAIVATKDMRPMLQLVIMRSRNNYAYFNCGLDGVNGVALAELIEYAKTDGDDLYAAAMTANGSFKISNIGPTNHVFDFAPL